MGRFILFTTFFLSAMLLVFAKVNIAQTPVVGTITGLFNVSTTGAAEYTIPIHVSPGTAGTAPSLSISYNSNAPIGVLGLGWTLNGISAITRGPKSHYTDGVVDGVRLGESDALYLDGIRLIEVAITGSGNSKRTEYRKEADDITRIFKYGSTLANANFIVQTKGGVTLKFDGSNSSTPRTSDGVPILWVVSRIFDTPGNFMEFHYIQNGQGDYAVSSVRYTGYEKKDGAGNVVSVESPYASVDFDYEILSRSIDSYVAGQLIRRTYRLKSIASRVSTIRGNGLSAGWPLLTRYEFEYDELNNNNRFILASVRQFGDDGTELHPTKFKYSKPQLGWKEANFQLPIAVLAGEEKLSQGYRFAYLQDGTTKLADLLFSALVEGKLESFAFKNQNGNWTADDKFKPPFAFVSAEGADLGAIVLDVNGDGRSDLIQSYQAAGQAPITNAYVASNGGWLEAVGYKIPFLVSTDGKRTGKFIFASFSGSGRPDLIYEIGGVRGFLINTGTQWQSDLSHIPPVSLHAAARALDVDCDGRLDLVIPDGAGWKAYRFDAVGWVLMPTPFNLSLPSDLPDAAIAQIDLNEDGYQDIIVASAQSNIRRAYIADATGWKEENKWAPHFDLVDQNGREMGAILTDVNSDGKLDIIANRIASDSQSVRFAFAQSSSGWTDLGSSFFVPPLLELKQNSPDNVTLVGDIDGDGFNDIAAPTGARHRFGRVYAGSSVGFVEKPEYVPAVAISRKSQQDYGVRFADLNADGLPDVIFRRDVTKEGTTTQVSGAYINTGTGWHPTPGLTPPQPIAADWISGSPMQLIDIDGDGFIDMLYHYRKSDGTTLRGYYRNMAATDGSRYWVEQNNSNLLPPLGYPFAVEKSGDQGVRFVDLNGDALVDMVASAVDPINVQNPKPVENCASLNAPQQCTLNRELFSGNAFLNNGTTWVETVGYSSPVPFVAKPDRVSDHTKNLYVDIIDVDGDRLPDLVARFKHPHKESLEVNEIWLNTGRGWRSSILKSPISLDAPNSDDRSSFQWIDVNADGLGDLLFTEKKGNVNNSRTWLSTGSGFMLSDQWRVPIEALSDQAGDQGFRVIDIDGDGLLDIIYSRITANAQQVRGVFLNNGTTWIAADPTAVNRVPAFINSEGHDLGVRLVDVDGNGLPDIIQAYNKSDGQVVERQSFLNKGRRSDVLSEVLSGYNAKISIAYLSLLEVPPAAQTANNTSTSPWPRVYTPAASQSQYPYLSPVPTAYVVSQITKEIPGNITRQFYRYGDFRLHATSLQPLGFGWREVYDKASNIITRNEYAREIEITGRSLREVSYLANFSGNSPVANVGAMNSAIVSQNEKLSETLNSWKLIEFIPGIISQTAKIRQVNLETTKSETWELDGQLVAREITNLTYDNPPAYLDRKLNVISTKVSRLDGTSVETVDEYDQDDLQQWLLGRLTKTVVKRKGDPVGGSASVGASTVRKEERRTSSFTYDPVTGLLQSSTIEPGNQKAVTTTYKRDQYGNITSTTLTASGEQPRSAFSEYDNLGRFVQQERNALEHKIIYSRNHKTGAPIIVIDANELQTSYTYDGFGRVKTETYCTGVVKTIRRLNSAAVPNWASDGLIFAYAEEISVGTLPSEMQLFDATGRIVRTVAQAFTLNSSLSRWVYVDRVYDKLGRMEKESLPYDSGTQPLWHSLKYDALNRVIEISQPSGKKVRTKYTGKAGGGRLLANFDEIGHRTLTDFNTRELPIAVIDQQNGRVSYDYDAGDRLEVMTGPTGAITRTKYDLFGLREQIADPDLGLWSYKHNAFGQLIQQTDAKGQITTIEYDVLGRPTNKSLGDGTTIEWQYDGSTRGKGKIQRIRDPGRYEQSFFYDQFGRPNRSAVTVATAVSPNTETFTTTTELDNYGRISKKHFPVPNGAVPFVAENIYDAKGFLTRVQSAGGAQLFWQALEIDELGRVVKEDFGNGVVTSHKYNKSTGELERIVSKKMSGGNILDLSLEYDAVGSLLLRKEAVDNISETFKYDALDRLETTKSGGTTMHYKYDAAGRIRAKTGTGQFYYRTDTQSGPWQPHHAVLKTGVGSNLKSYEYDSNGNRTKGNGRTIVYTPDNLVSEIIIDATHSVQFDYGPSGNRYRQILRDGEQLYETVCVGDFEQDREFDASNPTQPKTTQFRYHLSNADGIFVIFEKKINHVSAVVPAGTSNIAAANSNTWYLHKDQLGSTVRVTNGVGALAVSYWYEPWGRQTVSKVFPAGQNFGANRRQGFTGHEHLAIAGLTHMNGRIYDFETGMFLSADPVDLITGYTQTLGRYAYVQNNPLKYTDPSGFFKIRIKPRSIFRAAVGLVVGGPLGGLVANTKFVKENWREIAVVSVAVGVTVATGGAGAGMGAAILSGMAAGAASGATRAALYGGDFHDVLEGAARGGAIGGVSGAAFGGVGDAFSGASESFGSQLGQIGAHGVVGGGMSELEGGDFWTGFASGAITKASSAYGPQMSGVGFNIVKAAVVGGTVAEITGGKFANGAIIGAYSYALNDALHTAAQPSREIASENGKVVFQNEEEYGAYLESIDLPLEETVSPLDFIGAGASMIRTGIGRLGSRGLVAPSKYFRSRTLPQVERDLMRKYGAPRGQPRPGAKTWYNPNSGRSYNVHHQPGHQGGKPHVDIRRRGNYPERKFFLRD